MTATIFSIYVIRFAIILAFYILCYAGYYLHILNQVPRRLIIIYIPKTYFGDNRLGYNIEYFTQREIIADVLKQYERFLELSSEVKNEIFTDITLRRRD